uniref:Uncharacterized protein n=3 Tax=Aegilops tauschii subsp. strangulata TaxID=200361 RepID=A0A452ZXL1_AEGTS
RPRHVASRSSDLIDVLTLAHPPTSSLQQYRYSSVRQSSRDGHHHPPVRLPAPANPPARPRDTATMSISLRLVIPTAAPCPVPPPRTARNAGCSPLSAAAVPVRTTGALRGCAALPLRPQSLVRPCRSRGSGIVCNASAYLSPPTTQWVSVAAAAVLLLAKGTGIHKSFLVPLFVLQAPTAVISWIKSEYGLWTAFLALVVRLFLPFPGELELPLSTMLAVSVAPYQVMNVRYVTLAILKDISCTASLLLRMLGS